MNRLNTQNLFLTGLVAPDVIQDHESKSELHKTSILTTQDFLSTLENKEISTDSIHYKILSQTVSVN